MKCWQVTSTAHMWFVYRITNSIEITPWQFNENEEKRDCFTLPNTHSRTHTHAHTELWVYFFIFSFLNRWWERDTLHKTKQIKIYTWRWAWHGNIFDILQIHGCGKNDALQIKRCKQRILYRRILALFCVEWRLYSMPNHKLITSFYIHRSLILNFGVVCAADFWNSYYRCGYLIANSVQRFDAKQIRSCLLNTCQFAWSFYSHPYITQYNARRIPVNCKRKRHKKRINWFHCKLNLSIERTAHAVMKLKTK